MSSSLASPWQPGVPMAGCRGRVRGGFAGAFPPPAPCFGSPTEGRWPAPPFPWPHVCWEVTVQSAGVPRKPQGCSPTALLPSDPPSFAIPIPVPPQRSGSSAAGEGKGPCSPRHGGALPRRRGPPGPCWAPWGWAGRVPSLSRGPRRVPLGRAPGRAAGSADGALCFVPATQRGDKRGSQTRATHCAGSHALRQQPAPPRLPRDPPRAQACAHRGTPGPAAPTLPGP